MANWSQNFESLFVNCSSLAGGGVVFVEHDIIELIQIFKGVYA